MTCAWTGRIQSHLPLLVISSTSAMTSTRSHSHLWIGVEAVEQASECRSKERSDPRMEAQPPARLPPLQRSTVEWVRSCNADLSDDDLCWQHSVLIPWCCSTMARRMNLDFCSPSPGSPDGIVSAPENSPKSPSSSSKSTGGGGGLKAAFTVWGFTPSGGGHCLVCSCGLLKTAFTVWGLHFVYLQFVSSSSCRCSAVCACSAAVATAGAFWVSTGCSVVAGPWPLLSAGVATACEKLPNSSSSSASAASVAGAASVCPPAAGCLVGGGASPGARCFSLGLSVSL